MVCSLRLLIILENVFAHLTNIMHNIRAKSATLLEVQAFRHSAQIAKSEFSNLQVEIEKANLQTESEKRLDTEAAAKAFFDILLVVETTYYRRLEPATP